MKSKPDVVVDAILQGDVGVPGFKGEAGLKGERVS